MQQSEARMKIQSQNLKKKIEPHIQNKHEKRTYHV